MLLSILPTQHKNSEFQGMEFKISSCLKKNQKEIKEAIPFIIPRKIIKYLGINLHKEPKDLYSEN